MTWLVIVAAYVAIIVAANLIIGLVHGLVCLWLVEVSDYRFEKVTQRRITLNSLTFNEAEQKRRDRKRQAQFQWIDTNQISSRFGRLLGYSSNSLLVIAKTVTWFLILILPIVQFWRWSQ